MSHTQLEKSGSRPRLTPLLIPPSRCFSEPQPRQEIYQEQVKALHAAVRVEQVYHSETKTVLQFYIEKFLELQQKLHRQDDFVREQSRIISGLQIQVQQMQVIESRFTADMRSTVIKQQRLQQEPIGHSNSVGEGGEEGNSQEHPVFAKTSPSLPDYDSEGDFDDGEILHEPEAETSNGTKRKLPAGSWVEDERPAKRWRF